MIRTRWPALCLGLLLTLWLMPASAAVRAWLDREEIALGESVTLNVEVEGAGASMPDFAVLQQDFELLGSSSNSQISIVNGQRSATTLFAVGLEPRREGVVTVPPLTIGAESTEPLLLTVRPSPVSSGAGGDIFIESQATPLNPYVQQEVVYTLRLFYAVTVLDGQLEAPAPDGVRMLRLGDDSKYQVERGGRRYMVVERRFAMLPERSGELALDAPRFSGRGMDRNGLGGMFGGGVRLAARGEPITLQVQPRPAAASDPWLPARSLELAVVGPPLPAEAKVGEPLSLTLRLRAEGLSVEQLPELTLPELQGATVYPDQETSRDLSSSKGVSAEKLRRFAIVPNGPGALVIPPVRLDWWRVGGEPAGAAQTEIAEQRVLIAAAPGTALPPPPSAPTAANVEDAAAASADSVQSLSSSDSRGWLWPALSAALALGWIVTVLWMRRRSGRSTQPSPNRVEPDADAVPALREALQGGRLRDIAHSLRGLAPTGVGADLAALAARLADPAQRAAVELLERQLYAGANASDEAACLAALRAAFRRRPQWSKVASAAPGDALPPLYRH